MMPWMFRCQDVSHKVSQSMDDALPVHQRMAVWMHLLMCRYCLRFRKQMMLLRKLSRMTAHAPSPALMRDTLSKEARNRIKEKLKAAS